MCACSGRDFIVMENHVFLVKKIALNCKYIERD